MKNWKKGIIRFIGEDDKRLEKLTEKRSPKKQSKTRPKSKRPKLKVTKTISKVKKRNPHLH